MLRRPLRILAIASPAAKVDPTGSQHMLADVIGRDAKLVGNGDPHSQMARIGLGDDVIAADALARPDLDFGIAWQPTDDVQLLIVDDHGLAIGEVLVHDPCPSVQGRV